MRKALWRWRNLRKLRIIYLILSVSAWRRCWRLQVTGHAVRYHVIYMVRGEDLYCCTLSECPKTYSYHIFLGRQSMARCYRHDGQTSRLPTSACWPQLFNDSSTFESSQFSAILSALHGVLFQRTVVQRLRHLSLTFMSERAVFSTPRAPS